MHLRTGDLVLFADADSPSDGVSAISTARGAFGRLAQLGRYMAAMQLGLFGLAPFGHRAQITHVGIVLVNPPIDTVPRGTYLWETASEPGDRRGAVGVRLTRIASIDVSSRRVFVRRCAATIDEAGLREVYRDVHLRPYDMCVSEWLTGETRRLSDRGGLGDLGDLGDVRWCSAFVVYVLTRLGLLSWAESAPTVTPVPAVLAVRPSDLSSTGAAAARLGWCDKEPYGADVSVSAEEWGRMVARRVPTFDDHRACLAKGAASRLASLGVAVARPPTDMQAHFCVTVDREVRVSVPATEANRARFDAREPLHYAITQTSQGAESVPCTEETLLESIQTILRAP